MRRNLFIFLSLLTLSCKKSTAEKDTVPPVITITTPVNGDTYTNGQSVTITGTVTDDKYIAEIHVHVSNLVTGALLMDTHREPGGPNDSFTETFTAVAGNNYRIQVTAEDRGANETISTVEVSCN